MVRMSRRPKRYSQEFKNKSVRLAQESGRPIAEVARDLGVAYATLYDWVCAAEERLRPSRGGQGKDSPPPAVESESAELGRLRRENEELRKERDFLKKAAAFFARQNT
jgi:transposase